MKRVLSRLTRHVRRPNARARPASEIKTIRTDLDTCTAEVQELRRTLISLRAELDHLREKIRG